MLWWRLNRQYVPMMIGCHRGCDTTALRATVDFSHHPLGSLQLLLFSLLELSLILALSHLNPEFLQLLLEPSLVLIEFQCRLLACEGHYSAGIVFLFHNGRILCISNLSSTLAVGVARAQTLLAILLNQVLIDFVVGVNGPLVDYEVRGVHIVLVLLD